MSQQKSDENRVIPGPESLRRADETKQGKAFFVDGHVDLPYFMMNHAQKSSLSEIRDVPFTIEKAGRAGIRLFGTAIYCEDRFNGADSFTHFQDILNFTKRQYDNVVIIKNKSDLDGLIAKDEDTGTLLLLENGDALAVNIPFIAELKEEGIGIVGLTHAGKNRLADGNSVQYPDGFTLDGKEVVDSLHANGLIIDVAHLHPKCFWQLLDLTEGPLISSHTGVRDLFNTPRNISLEQAKELFIRGGIVGITFNPEMLAPGGEACLEDVFAHLDTVVQKFGPKGVGIGSDYCGFDLVTEGLEDITGIT
ncbi:MAG: membrane dipeptidase, partial [Deltaproteobacteria bacterium]|nr:membrane dipeptidase [Deltaproteobacteria bacterium]